MKYLIFLTFWIFNIGCGKIGYDKIKDIQTISINCYILSDNEYVINNESEYYLIIDTNNCQPTYIDFSQYTLIGKYANGGGCSVEFKRNFYINNEDKIYLYEIKVKEKGWCKKHYENMNWIIVPKIQSGYTVIFKIKYNKSFAI